MKTTSSVQLDGNKNDSSSTAIGTSIQHEDAMEMTSTFGHGGPAAKLGAYKVQCGFMKTVSASVVTPTSAQHIENRKSKGSNGYDNLKDQPITDTGSAVRSSGLSHASMQRLECRDSNLSLVSKATTVNLALGSFENLQSPPITGSAAKEMRLKPRSDNAETCNPSDVKSNILELQSGKASTLRTKSFVQQVGKNLICQKILWE